MGDDVSRHDKHSHKVLIGSTDEGKWAATSVSPPYFFFEGDSESEVVAIAQRAFLFYYGSVCEVSEMPRKSRDQPRLSRFTQRQEVCVEA